MSNKEWEINKINHKISILKSKLSATDYMAIKYAEGEISATDYVEVKVQRRTWRAEINALEKELKNLGV